MPPSRLSTPIKLWATIHRQCSQSSGPFGAADGAWQIRARLDLDTVDLDAVIFDWGGTLTPWHSIDAVTLWSAVCAPHFPAEEAEVIAAALHTAESALWRASFAEHRSATLSGLFDLAGVSPTDALLASYVDAWEPHTFTDPDAPALLSFLRENRIRTGVLSNTMWPRSWHEDVFRRDGVLDLIDGAVYSSEIDWTKPHPDAFRAAMIAIGVANPERCVFVGDRPYEDVHGAKSAGMRAVLVRNSDVPPFDAAKPDAVIDQLAELRDLIELWC
jgi:putative hydrolase of the HAD superfamily